MHVAAARRISYFLPIFHLRECASCSSVNEASAISVDVVDLITGSDGTGLYRE